MAKRDNDFEQVMAYLAKKQPFFAMLVQGMVKNFRTDIPTAGVGIQDGKIHLHINPLFMKQYNIVQQAEILKHECMHIVHDHISRSKVMAKLQNPEEIKTEEDLIDRVKAMFEQRAENYAADMEINEFLLNLPKKFKMLDRHGKPIVDPKTGKKVVGRPVLVDDIKLIHPDIQKFSTAEYYLEFLKKNGKKIKIGKGNSAGDGSGQSEGDNDGESEFMSVDSHDLWQEGDESADAAKEVVRQAVNKAVEASGGMGSGNIPSNIEALIQKLNESTISWKAVLKRFVATATEYNMEFTRKVRNRRFGTLLQGYKKEPLVHLVVGIDRSGSVHQEELSQFMAEIDKIHQAGARVTVMVCDTQVNEVFEYSKNKNYSLKGGGGTYYQPMIDKARELKGDALVIFGDGDCADNPKKPRFPVLWALTRKSKRPANFGGLIHVDVKKGR